MKFTAVFAVAVAFASAVSAVPIDTPATNAKRMAAGLPPLPPVRRSPVIAGGPSPSYRKRAPVPQPSVYRRA